MLNTAEIENQFPFTIKNHDILQVNVYYSEASESFFFFFLVETKWQSTQESATFSQCILNPVLPFTKRRSALKRFDVV